MCLREMLFLQLIVKFEDLMIELKLIVCLRRGLLLFFVSISTTTKEPF
jgi:hypothetical protein